MPTKELTLFTTWKKRVEDRLEQWLPESPRPLIQAARYSLFSPAKRIRPLLVLSGAQIFQSPFPAALDVACSIELIHTYSLIHDDLPCMDDDLMRRGRPTLHTLYGEGIALLTGDFLLTRAFEILSCSSEISDRKKVQLLQNLSAKAGIEGMVGGQEIDLCAEGSILSEEQLNAMHLGKTAALLSASLECGALLSDTVSDLPLLQSLGRDLGLCYQYQDDLLDAVSKKSSDEKKKKSTAVSLWGAEKTSEKIHELREKIWQKLVELPGDTTPLQTLCVQIFERTF